MPSVLRFPRLLRGPELETPVIARERTTSRLVLRPYRRSDAEAWLEIENDESIRNGLGWAERTPRQALVHLRHRTHHDVLRQSGDLLVLAVEHDNEVIGDVSLHLRSVAPDTRSLEIGWLQLASASGHGFATEAAEAMLDVAFDEVGACLVTAVVLEENVSSARLARRLGFRLASRSPEASTFVLASEDRAHRSTSPTAARRAA